MVGSGKLHGRNEREANDRKSHWRPSARPLAGLIQALSSHMNERPKLGSARRAPDVHNWVYLMGTRCGMSRPTYAVPPLARKRQVTSKPDVLDFSCLSDIDDTEATRHFPVLDGL